MVPLGMRFHLGATVQALAGRVPRQFSKSKIFTFTSRHPMEPSVPSKA
jgi:hypothetical protein